MRKRSTLLKHSAILLHTLMYTSTHSWRKKCFLDTSQRATPNHTKPHYCWTTQGGMCQTKWTHCRPHNNPFNHCWLRKFSTYLEGWFARIGKSHIVGNISGYLVLLQYLVALEVKKFDSFLNLMPLKLNAFSNLMPF